MTLLRFPEDRSADERSMAVGRGLLRLGPRRVSVARCDDSQQP